MTTQEALNLDPTRLSWRVFNEAFSTLKTEINSKVPKNELRLSHRIENEHVVSVINLTDVTTGETLTASFIKIGTCETSIKESLLCLYVDLVSKLQERQKPFTLSFN
jgi:hypothetical protein